jgi:hypothetical protein
MEAAEVMSLPEGNVIVFSRGIRHVAEDSRKTVLMQLQRLPAPPEVRGPQLAAQATNREEDPKQFW